LAKLIDKKNYSKRCHPYFKTVPNTHDQGLSVFADFKEDLN
jgi:hypothetical protein